MIKKVVKDHKNIMQDQGKMGNVSLKMSVKIREFFPEMVVATLIDDILALVISFGAFWERFTSVLYSIVITIIFESVLNILIFLSMVEWAEVVVGERQHPILPYDKSTTF